MRIQLFVLFLLFSCNLVFPQGKRMSKDDYISKYKEYAIKEMNRAGIPASITLAQGSLESDNGNSTLARKANNHFGIKCHDWTGDRMFQDDDEKDECFRKYDSPYESFRDHSDFLRKTSRYQFLFTLSPMDYKGWAKGLKKAGYATSRTYADDLIRIIEESNLHQYDLANIEKGKKRKHRADIAAEETAREEADAKQRRQDSIADANSDHFVVNIQKHPIYVRNRRDYVLVKPGDTYESLTRELNLLPWELAMFNEIDKTKPLISGSELFLQPKRMRAARGYDFHIVQDGETMYLVAQHYGIKLKQLYEKNRMKEGEEPAVGTKLWLRRKKPNQAN